MSEEPRFEASSPPASTDKRYWIIVAGILGVLGLGGLIALGASSAGSSGQVLSGTVEVELQDYYGDETWESPGSWCTGLAGYDDMESGADVIVRDGAGKVLGSSVLSSGSVGSTGRTCDFTFVVEDLPNSTSYAVKIGNRSPLSYSRTELEDSDWELSLSLGS